jgi:glycosyltransferase involved in cell wall biosynthesis
VNIVTAISIVVPTLNRCESLRKLLLSILRQTSLPEEVIVVDDSDDDETLKLVRENSDFFSNKGILLMYSRGNRDDRSISAARNIGATKSTGEIVLFLDDDVVLDSKYIEEVLKTYEEYPEAKGVQGYMVSEEGLDLSYRIYKRYPNSLFMNSRARLIHRSTFSACALNKSSVYRDALYFVYLFFKNYEQTIQNRVLLLWSLLGRLVIGRGLYLFVSKDVKSFFNAIEAYMYTLSNLNDVRRGDFRFIDSIV